MLLFYFVFTCKFGLIKGNVKVITDGFSKIPVPQEEVWDHSHMWIDVISVNSILYFSSYSLSLFFFVHIEGQLGIGGRLFSSSISWSRFSKGNSAPLSVDIVFCDDISLVKRKFECVDYVPKRCSCITRSTRVKLGRLSCHKIIIWLTRTSFAAERFSTLHLKHQNVELITRNHDELSFHVVV